jgi:hypothetical protein
MQTQIEKDVAALSALANTSVNAIITASPVLSAALAGANLAATRDQVQTISNEVRSTGTQTTGWT